MDFLLLWIVFGLVYGLVTWAATRKNPNWWFIGIVFTAGAFGIFVIIIGATVKFFKIIKGAIDNREKLSPGEAEALNRKRAIYLPVFFVILTAIILTILYGVFDITLLSIIRSLIKIGKGIF